MRNRGGEQIQEKPKTQGSNDDAVNRYYSPQIFALLFFALGIVCWSLFSYSPRSVAKLIRGEPRGRKYLNTEKGKVHDATDVTLYVIPGGGSGSGDEGEGVLNYPEWTKRRTVAAVKHAKERKQTLFKQDAGLYDGAYFLALSAGSLNSANRLSESSKQVVFECTYTINHLIDLGVPRDRILGDFMSWDTIANAMVLRMTVKGILEKTFGYLQPGEDEMGRGDSSSWASPYFRGNQLDEDVVQGMVNIEVFISDFHLERVEAAFQWVLSLTPSLLPRLRLKMHSVGSEGIPGLSFFGPPDMWGNPAPVSEVAKVEFMRRQAHEKQGLEQIKTNQKKIKSESAFFRWLMLGGHGGYANYLDGTYQKSQGTGW